MTRKETVEMLSISLTTLRAWTVQRIVKGYRLGGRIYYKENEIIASMKIV
ncbi:MAG: helix-turn-helix domain-containing protein [Crocinitomicaceae bacterium]|nr:helix-turn-helix domain-containing protein [Crocinitomicaceae bacterium]